MEINKRTSCLLYKGTLALMQRPLRCILMDLHNAILVLKHSGYSSHPQYGNSYYSFYFQLVAVQVLIFRIRHGHSYF